MDAGCTERDEVLPPVFGHFDREIVLLQTETITYDTNFTKARDVSPIQIDSHRYSHPKKKCLCGRAGTKPPADACE
jgi:hypothetical protein